MVPIRYLIPTSLILALSLLPLRSKAQTFDQGLAPDSTHAMVPDAKTAIRIAVAIWLPIYGKEIKHEKPYVAKLLENGVWEVKGTLKGRRRRGGVACAWIQKSDGKILKYLHGK